MSTNITKTSIRKRVKHEEWGLIEWVRHNDVSIDEIIHGNSSGGRTNFNQNNYLPAVVDGKLLDMEAFCKHYGLEVKDVLRYKLVTHAGGAYYNITMADNSSDKVVDDMREVFEREIKKTRSPLPLKGRVGVVTVTDIHIGSKTENYNIEVIIDSLDKIAKQVNKMGFDSVVVNNLGDTIETFSGKNHPNSWQSIEEGMYGANVVKVAADILDNFLSKIDNLSYVNFIGGNHGRSSASRDEDTKAGAEDLIAYCLELMGHDIRFNPRIISEEIDGVQYILTHGDKRISKLAGAELVLQYGDPKKFNLIQSGHLHTEKFEEESDIFRKYKVSPIIKENEYSKDGGWTSRSGYSVAWNNGDGIPHILNARL